jgi:hypothetical protein
VTSAEMTSSSSTVPAMTPRTARTGYRIAIGVSLVGFALMATSMLSPLRLNTDAATLLHLATTLSDGKPYLNKAAGPTVFPRGLPLLYSSLDRAHLASPAVLVLLNLIAILMVTVALYGLYRQRFLSSRAAIAGTFATTFSWVIIKHVPIPLTDTVFTGLSMITLGSLGYVSRSIGFQRLVWLSIAVALTAMSLMVRRNGVALIPPLVWVMVPWKYLASQVVAFAKGRPLRWAGLIAVAMLFIAGGAIIVAQRLELHDMTNQLHGQGVLGLLAVPISHLHELGELIINTSGAPFARFELAFQSLGVLLLMMMAIGLIARRTRWSHVDAYIVTFASIVLIWPFTDSRFWIPIIPLMPLYVLEGLDRLIWRNPTSPASRWQRRATAVYAVFFGLAGLAAHAYSVRLTLSGSAFPDRYGSGSHSAAYRRVLLGEESSTPLDEDERLQVQLLLRFGQKSLHR